MTALPTDAIRECIENDESNCSRPHEFADIERAKAQLQALLDENADLSRTVRALEYVVVEKDARIAELETAISLMEYNSMNLEDPA